ncbi:MAG: hypothetical protein AAFQ79_06880 [Pseudomonadota bacterium]
MAVGNVEQWQRAGHTLPASSDLYFCAFEQLDQTFIDLFEPAVVLTPVVSMNFDCADVALRLYDADYPGSVRALGRDLPRPEIVEREIRALCPALDFAILDIDDLLRLS